MAPTLLRLMWDFSECVIVIVIVSTSASRWNERSVIDSMMAEVPTRLQQLDLAKSSLQTELREAHELDAERLRYDRYAAREEAEETPRQVADAAACSSKTENDALGVCEETFSRKDAEWHRSSLR